MIALVDLEAGRYQIVESVAGNDITGREIVALPDDWDERPYRLNGSTFVVDLAAIRMTRWLAVRTARDVAQDSGCPSPLGRVDTDLESRGKISGSVQMAMIAQAAGAPFEIAWTMQDNTTVVHDAPAMIAMGVAVGQHVAACHAEALSRRTLIEQAADEASILAVPVEGGWPGETA